MGVVETALLKAAKAATTAAVTSWVARRRAQRERTSSLVELINTGITDDLMRRRAQRSVDDIVDVVYERLQPLIRGRFARLPKREVAAVIDAVSDTFATADLSDEAIFANNVNPDRLVNRLRKGPVNWPDKAGLGEAGERLYLMVLRECCVCLIQLVVQMRPFEGRALTEILGRQTDLSTALAAVLDRLPVTTVDAPTGVGHDTQFRDWYLAHLLGTMDHLELFGVDVHRYQLRTPLSVAYISLTVTSESGQRIRADDRWDLGVLRRQKPLPQHDAGVRVERALGDSRRILLRGEAGSGKTTLVQWIAVTAARSAFTGELSDWNGRVPFVIRLRDYVDRDLPNPEQFLDRTAAPLVGLLPTGWVHRRLADGAVLCVDGVDEVPGNQRQHVLRWLRDLLALFPELRVVVTSRPAAAAVSWLRGEGFSSVILNRMGPSDVRALIRHWHDAIRPASDLPCDPRQLPEYEHRLLAQLDGNAHLQALAGSPLLCAMLCALNLDRDSQLPRNRMDLYQAAMDMLLERRDRQRDVRVELPDLTSRDRIHLLQQIAWWLTINGRTELGRDEARRQIAQRLAGMRPIGASDQQVLNHLVYRSGILREPALGRIDFVHRTFQEYLAAREAAEQGNVGALVEHAHWDTWRETIVLAAGHAHDPVLRELLTDILDRADREPQHARKLRLLAAACLETTSAMAPDLRRRVRTHLRHLLPPRSTAEAPSLAAIGEPLLDDLPTEPDGLSAAQATAVVRAAALVNGPAALGLLARFATDPRPHVQRELIAAWDYFDPIRYAEQVLADAPLNRGSVTIQSTALIPALSRLRHLTETRIDVADLDLADLADVPHLTSLYISNVTGDLAALADHPELQRLSLSFRGRRVDLSPLAALPRLTVLLLWSLYECQDLTALTALAGLTSVMLEGASVTSLDFLASSLPTLEFLQLNTRSAPDLSALTGAPRLRRLTLVGTAMPTGGLENITYTLPGLTTLRLHSCDWASDLGPLHRLEELRDLGFINTPVTDLSPLAHLPHLHSLMVGSDEHLPDLATVAAIPTLRDLWIWRSPSPVDLRPLASRRLTVYIDKDLVALANTGPIESLRIKRW